jgi:glycosyltransferase involved in cell wall biosynthesis
MMHDDARAPASDLTILIPAFNEEEGLGPTLASLRNEPRLVGARIIVIDDGSTDKTAEVAKAAGVDVARHKNNQGYGAGIKTGTRRARTPYVAWFDADGQHRSQDLADMYTAALRDGYDAVLGARTAGSNVVAKRVLGKIVLGKIANFVVNQRIPDINCGLRVFRRELLTSYLPLLPDGFSASTTSTLLFIKRNRHFTFHPVVTEARAGTSTVKQVRDGMRTIHLMMRILFLFSAFRAFASVAGLFLSAGVIYSAAVALRIGQGVPVLGALLFLVGVIVFCFGILSDQVSALRIDLLERGVGRDAGDWSARTHE